MNRIASNLTPPIVTKLIKKALGIKAPEPMPSFLHNSVRSYSQFQEDLLLDELLGRKENGFYVDIGANHPEVLSNTKRFYDRGWHGINVEPLTENYRLFEQQRQRDINLNVGVGGTVGEMVFYQCSKRGGAYSGFDKSKVLRYATEEEIVTRTIPVLTLSEVLSKYTEEGTLIDFLSVDVEGLELQVLNGNDWTTYRPHLIIIEFGDCGTSIVEFLEARGYCYVFSNGINGVFVADQP